MYSFLLVFGCIGLAGTALSVFLPNTGNWMWAMESLGLSSMCLITPAILF